MAASAAESLTYRLPVESILKDQARAKRRALYRLYADDEYGWVDRALCFLRPFTELPAGEDAAVVRNVASLRGVRGTKQLIRELQALGIRQQWVVNSLCLDGPMLALNVRALDLFASAQCPLALGAFLNAVGDRGWRTRRTDEWSLVESNRVMIASRRVFAQRGAYYFLLLPARYLLEQGFAEDQDRLDTTIHGWSPIDGDGFWDLGDEALALPDDA